MKNTIQLTGLSKSGGDIFASLSTKKEDSITKVPIVMDFETKEGLWLFCKSNWDKEKIATISHDGLSDDGTPMNCKVLHVGLDETIEL